MDEKVLQARIDELGAQIQMLCDERQQIKQRLAEMQTTLKVGDRVTYDGAKDVWELRAIIPGYNGRPRYYGARIIKKYGTPAARVAEIWQVPLGKHLVAIDADGRQADPP